MKKLFLLLFCLLFAVSIGACTPATEPLPKISPVDYHNYPGLEWGMTEQEALQALGLTEQEVTWSEEKSEDIAAGFTYTTEETVFGAVPSTIACLFSENTVEKKNMLVNVTVYYGENDEEHVENVKNALVQEYGSLEDQVITHASPDGNGHVTFATHDNNSGKEGYYWRSPKSFADVLPKEKLERIRQEQSDAGEWNEADWQKYMEHQYLSTIYFKATPVEVENGGSFIRFMGDGLLYVRNLPQK